MHVRPAVLVGGTAAAFGTVVVVAALKSWGYLAAPAYPPLTLSPESLASPDLDPADGAHATFAEIIEQIVPPTEMPVAAGAGAPAEMPVAAGAGAPAEMPVAAGAGAEAGAPAVIPGSVPASARRFRYTNGVVVGSGADVKAVYAGSYETTLVRQVMTAKVMPAKVPLNPGDLL
jgi:hypothetical protein